MLWECGKSVLQYPTPLIQVKEKAEDNCPNRRGSPVPLPDELANMAVVNESETKTAARLATQPPLQTTVEEAINCM